MAPRLLILLTAIVIGGLFFAGLFVSGRVGGVLLAVCDVGLIAVALRSEQQFTSAATGSDAPVADRRRPLRLIVVALVTALAAIKIAHG